MIVGELWTRWPHRRALLGGWLAGMTYGTLEAYAQGNATARHSAARWQRSLDSAGRPT